MIKLLKRLFSATRAEAVQYKPSCERRRIREEEYRNLLRRQKWAHAMYGKPNKPRTSQ